MIEGWFGDEYLILFDPVVEAPSATAEYALHDTLPGYLVVGIRGWEDLILSHETGPVSTVPSVPIDPQYLEAYELPNTGAFEADARFTGKIKWHVKPIVFGGSPTAEDNIAWVSHANHRQLVRYWNDLYRQLKSAGA